MKTLCYSLIAWITLTMALRFFGQAKNEASIIYVSQQKGNDSLSCGTNINPCKTIAMGVLLAKQGAQVYVDGTASKKNPFTCRTLSINVQGILSNKSLSIIGVHSIVYVKCQEGYSVKLVKSMQDKETVVTISNLMFVETTISSQDIHLYIKNCSFINGTQAVSLVQLSRPIALLFTNSVCINSSSCIAVSVRGHVLPINKISINVTNSNVIKSWWKSFAPGLHIASQDDDSVWQILCTMKFKNVSFKYNTVGPNGLIFVNAINASTFMTFQDVLFLRSKMNTIMPSLITIHRSSDHNMILTNTSFLKNFEGNCRAVEVNVESTSTLSIVDSRFEMFNTGQYGKAGLFFMKSSNDIKVSIENTIFANNIGGQSTGGILFLNGLRANLELKDSHFYNNQAGCAGILWLPIQDCVTVKIHGCYFESSSAFGLGGLASIQSHEAVIEMVNCSVKDSITSGPGGLFDIGHMGCGTSKIAHNATLILQNVEIAKSGSRAAEGGVAVIQAATGFILIQDSKFTNVFSSFQGGVICAYYDTRGLFTQLNQTDGFNIKMVNSFFHEIRTSASPGVILYSNGINTLNLHSVIIESIISGGNRPLPGGAIAIQSNIDAKVLIDDVVVRGCTGWGSALNIRILTAKSTIQIRNSLFDSNEAIQSPGGCLSFYVGITNILLQNVTFHQCISILTAGGALYVNGQNRGKITLQSCSFISNTALRGTGGAVAFELLYRDKILNPGCVQTDFSFTNYRLWSYNNSLIIRNTTFYNNTAINGGALSLSRGEHIIESCSFLDNHSNLQGGHLYLISDSTSLKVVTSKFLQNHSSLDFSSNYGADVQFKSNTGLFIYSISEGPLMVLNTTMELTWSRHENSEDLIYISKGNLIDFGKNNQTIVKCPRGSRLDVVNYTTVVDTECEPAQPCRIALTLLRFDCHACPLNTYSLQHGHSFGMNWVSSFKCLPCPFGAECHSKISAKPNYWGYKVRENSGELSFTQCPKGYCSKTNPNNFENYNQCLGNRIGTICGHCKDNYSETLLSPSCRPDDECRDTWLWGVAVFMAIVMAMYLIYKPRVSCMLKKQILWFNYFEAREPEDEVKEKIGGGGYMKIVFYFYQVVNIVLVDTSYDNTIKSHLLQPVIGLFNFQYRLPSSGLLCPFRGLTAVTKQLFFSSQVFAVEIMIALFYGCHCVLSISRSRPQPNLGPYLGAALETLLLGYAIFANTSLQLLRCTSLAGDLRLFIDGTISCPQWWQYVLMVFFSTAVVPFVLIVAIGSHWLNKGTISVKEFMISCVLPLPYLVYKLAAMLRGPHEVQQEPREWKTSIANVLYGPFRDSLDGRFGVVYWESILILRRLIFVVIYVFIQDPMSKELVMTLVSVVILCHHVLVKPFRDPGANTIEMISLFCVFTLCSINTFKASFLSFGETQKGPLTSFDRILDWVQIVILIALPAVSILVIVAAIASQVIRLSFKVFSCVFRHSCAPKSRGTHVIDDDTNQDLLEPSGYDAD